MSVIEQLTGITVLWPRMLWPLALLPLLILMYLGLAARQRRSHAQLPGLQVPSAPRSPGAALRRALPPILLFVALFALLAALSRPQAIVTLPSIHKDIVLALDISGSMRATDVQPNRLAAAQSAARAFIERRPPRTRVGIVSVAGNATLVQSLTDKREDLLQAIERVQLQRGTALGSGIYIALATLLPDAGLNIEQLVHGRPDLHARLPSGMDRDRKPETYAAPGSNRSVAILLLSDGESNHGPDPVQAAKLAAEHGVRIYTVGIGSTEGITLSFAGSSMRVRLDEETLRAIADTTLGDYHAASSAPELRRIYEHLSARMAIERASTVEITALLVAAGALLLTISAFCSMLWFNRVA
jgi:Ca-activated chloride channel family protein